MDVFFSWVPLAPLEVLYTLLFWLFVVFTIYPPLEFIAAGVTLENIFGRFLGSENVFFFEYHLRRTAMLRVVCSFYLLLYYGVMRSLSPSVVLNSPNIQPPFTLWDLILWTGIASFTFLCSHTYIVWYAQGAWSGHPTVISLKKLSDSTKTEGQSSDPPDHSWLSYVSSINAECRRPDKFVASQGGLSSSWPGRRVIVTDSWILTSHFTKFRVVKQSSDELIAVVASASSVFDTNSFTEGGRPAGESLGTQTMVTVRFANVHTGACILSFGLLASNLDALRSKLQCPLIHAEGVQLEPTVVQRFIEAFTRVVEENDLVSPPPGLDELIGIFGCRCEVCDFQDCLSQSRTHVSYSGLSVKFTQLCLSLIHTKELEQCIGCASQPANVMLSQRCDPEAHAQLDAEIGSAFLYVPPCGVCRCRPMWCLECMARWFASRQTESHRPPNIWLSGRVPCPTCRSIFCVRDECAAECLITMFCVKDNLEFSNTQAVPRETWRPRDPLARCINRPQEVNLSKFMPNYKTT
ncbi:hypothetical protein X801_05839 [Opisthorchis viverrini]|uniref:Uncharacterized protein n=1 Tax=Opisthorchis viverrini TaxID=6198 RepID=A0A1S8WV55_OPIVI|nr:hypothetical protein X801_05839 [Opisthorchis viverrini]